MPFSSIFPALNGNNITITITITIAITITRSSTFYSFYHPNTFSTHHLKYFLTTEYTFDRRRSLEVCIAANIFVLAAPSSHCFKTASCLWPAQHSREAANRRLQLWHLTNQGIYSTGSAGVLSGQDLRKCQNSEFSVTEVDIISFTEFAIHEKSYIYFIQYDLIMIISSIIITP